MPTKKHATITDERPLEAEQGQEAPELSKKEIAAQMWSNAKGELDRIASDRAALEQLLEDKQHQRGLLLQQCDEAGSHYQTALNEQEAAAGRVVREQGRLQIAQGTGGEQEHEAILQSLIADLDLAKSRVAEAERARDEANERAEIIPALTNAIAEIHSQLADLARQEAEMEALVEEQHRAYGLAIVEELRDGIDAARARKEQGREISQRAEEDEELVQSRIARELKEWPDLAEQMHFSHGSHKPRAKTDAEIVREAHATYVKVLRDHGKFLGSRGVLDRQRFCNQLDLNPSFTQAVMLGGDHEFATKQRLELIKDLR